MVCITIMYTYVVGTVLYQAVRTSKHYILVKNSRFILTIFEKYVSMFTYILLGGCKKMQTGNLTFGEYLKNLIRQCKMTQTEFYTQLGITKPYFYDILSAF